MRPHAHKPHAGIIFHLNCPFHKTYSCILDIYCTGGSVYTSSPAFLTLLLTSAASSCARGWLSTRRRERVPVVVDVRKQLCFVVKLFRANIAYL